MDYYSLLGISRNATPDQIRAAYRTAIKKWHPDLNRDNIPLSSLITSQLNEAYRVLMNPSERKQYDQSLGIHDGMSNSEEKGRYTYTRKETVIRNSRGSSSRLKEVERIESWKNTFFSYMARHKWASSIYASIPEKTRTRIISGSSDLSDIMRLYFKIEEAKVRMGLSSAYFNLMQLEKYREEQASNLDVTFTVVSSLEAILQFYIRIRGGIIENELLNSYELSVEKKFVQIHKYLVKHPNDLFQAIERFKISKEDWETARGFIR